MKILLIIILISILGATKVFAQKKQSPPPPVPKRQTFTCFNSKTRCFLKKLTCPEECPSRTLIPNLPKAKVCYINCDSPICKAECKHQLPNCNTKGAACYDPRFIGGDGIVFYFHGKSNEHFTLVSDTNLQINARFIGLRPPGRSRDFTWIQALGILFNSHTFSIDATKATKWDVEIDHLKFSYDGQEIFLRYGTLSQWNSQEYNIKLERTSMKNSVIITIKNVVEIAVKVVHVTDEDNRIHSYHIPGNDCFAHMEVQFRFFGLTTKVEGVIGKTYQPDFVNPAKSGVAMPIVGGEDKYKTTSLLSADCKYCIYNPEKFDQEIPLLIHNETVDCSRGLSGGIGIICKK